MCADSERIRRMNKEARGGRCTSDAALSHLQGSRGNSQPTTASSQSFSVPPPPPEPLPPPATEPAENGNEMINDEDSVTWSPVHREYANDFGYV